MPPRHHLVWRALTLLALVVLTVYALVQAQAILLPLVIAGLFAMLFSPVVGWLAERMPRGVAIGIVVLCLFLVIAGALLLAGSQVSGFIEDAPVIQQKATQLLEDAQAWTSEQLGISQTRIENRIDEQLDEAPQKLSQQARSWAGSFIGFLGDFLLFFVYLILLLASSTRLVKFVYKLVPQQRHDRVDATLTRVRKVAGQYLWGRLLLIAALFGVYYGGFTLAGLNYALVLAAIGGVLSIIPYFGNIVAAGLVLVMASFAEDVQSTMLIGLGTMALAQVLESYVLEPLVVGNEVDLNPLTTVVAVVAFTSIWGIAGAILAIPIVGILRQVLLSVPRGEPWSYLLGNSEDD